MSKSLTLLAALLCIAPHSFAQGGGGATRVVAGRVATERGEVVPGVTVVVSWSAGEQRVETDAEGNFRAVAPREPLTLRFFGKNIALVSKTVAADERAEDLQIRVAFVVAPVREGVVVHAPTVEPTLERRDDAALTDALFLRDDQLLQNLNAGISAGQHEGGGKSLEIRRFGFNLDHGGAGGGLKVLVDDVQQNQATQAHGQGYLGGLKSLTPERTRPPTDGSTKPKRSSRPAATSSSGSWPEEKKSLRPKLSLRPSAVLSLRLRV